jgi:hypothetical protein
MDVGITISTALQAEKLQDYDRIYDLWLSLIGHFKIFPHLLKKVSSLV